MVADCNTVAFYFYDIGEQPGMCLHHLDEALRELSKADRVGLPTSAMSGLPSNFMCFFWDRLCVGGQTKQYRIHFPMVTESGWGGLTYFT